MRSRSGEEYWGKPFKSGASIASALRCRFFICYGLRHFDSRADYYQKVKLAATLSINVVK